MADLREPVNPQVFSTASAYAFEDAKMIAGEQYLRGILKSIINLDARLARGIANALPRAALVMKAYLRSRYLVGMRPWTPGYAEYKEACCAKLLCTGLPTVPFGRTLDERIVELPWVFGELAHARRILDAGSALNFGFFLDRLADKQVYILTLYPEPFRSAHGESYIYEDLRNVSFKDETFDAIACVSTIEHVGLDCSGYMHGKALRRNDTAGGDRLTVIRELKRVLAPGGPLLLTAPFGRPVESATFCNLDRDDVREIVSTFSPASSEIRYFVYGRDGWSESGEDDERLHSATYRGNGAAAAGAVVLMKLVK